MKQLHAADSKRGKVRASEWVTIHDWFGWLKEWREFCQPITERSKTKPMQTITTFDTQLKKMLRFLQMQLLIILNLVRWHKPQKRLI